MNKYVISYDLDKENHKYSQLIDFLKSFPGYVHVQKSCWLIKSHQSLNSISRQIDAILNFNDEYLILEFTGPHIGNIAEDVYRDLKKFLS